MATKGSSQVDELGARFELLQTLMKSKQEKERRSLDVNQSSQKALLDQQHADMIDHLSTIEIQSMAEAKAAEQRARAADEATRAAGPAPPIPRPPNEGPIVRTPTIGSSELSGAADAMGLGGPRAAAAGGAAVQSIAPYTAPPGAPSRQVGGPGQSIPGTGVQIIDQVSPGGKPGAMDLPAQGALPEAPPWLANLQVSQRTAPTPVGPMGDMFPMTTSDRQITMSPNVLTAAQREALSQQRYEFANEYNLKKGQWRVDALTKLGDTFGGAAATAIVKAVSENGEIPIELARQLKSMSQYGVEEEQKRTQISAFAARTQAQAVADLNRHNLAMEGVEKGRLNLDALNNDRNFLINTSKLMLEQASANQDAGLKSQAMEVQKWGMELNFAISQGAQAVEVWRTKYESQYRAWLQDRENQAKMDMLTTESGQLDNRQSRQLSFGRWDRAAQIGATLELQRQGHKNATELQNLEGDQRIEQIRAQGWQQLRVATREADARYELAMDLANERSSNDQVLASIAQAGQVTEAQSRVIVETIKAEQKQREAELVAAGLSEKEARLRIVAEASLQRDNSLAQSQRLGALAKLTDSTVGLLATREALSPRAGVVNQTIQNMQAGGSLTADSLTTGTMMGYSANEPVAKRDPAAALARISSVGWFGKGAKVVDPNADPAVFYEAAVPSAITGDKILALDDKNGVTYLDGKMVAGLWATASGYAAGATPDQVGKAQAMLTKYKLGERRGGRWEPYSKGVTTAWANAYAITFDQNILANPAYLTLGIKQAGQVLGGPGLGGGIYDPSTGQSYAPAAAVTGVSTTPTDKERLRGQLYQTSGSVLKAIQDAVMGNLMPGQEQLGIDNQESQ